MTDDKYTFKGQTASFWIRTANSVGLTFVSVSIHSTEIAGSSEGSSGTQRLDV